MTRSRNEVEAMEDALFDIAGCPLDCLRLSQCKRKRTDVPCAMTTLSLHVYAKFADLEAQDDGALSAQDDCHQGSSE